MGQQQRYAVSHFKYVFNTLQLYDYQRRYYHLLVLLVYVNTYDGE